MSHLSSPIEHPAPSCYDYDASKFATLTPTHNNSNSNNNPPLMDMNSMSFSIPLDAIPMGSRARSSMGSLSTFTASSSSSLSMLQNPSTSSVSSSTVPSNISKRRSQVKNACVNCQKACKRCDEGRPCQRCIKLGITDTCVDSPRKERRKGFKRGPYKKKATVRIEQVELIQENLVNQLHSPTLYSPPIAYAIQPLDSNESLMAQDRFNLYYNSSNIKNDNRNINNVLIDQNIININMLDNLAYCTETQQCEIDTEYNQVYHAIYHHGDNTNYKPYYSDNHISYHHGNHNPKIGIADSFETETHYYFDAMQQQQQHQQNQHYLQQQQQQQQQQEQQHLYMRNDLIITNAHTYLTNHMQVDPGCSFYAHYYNPEI